MKDETKRSRTLGSVCITISIPGDLLADVDAIAETDNMKRSAAIQMMIKRGFAGMRLSKELDRELTWDELIEQGRANDKKIQETLEKSCKGIKVKKSRKKPLKKKKEVKK